MKASDKLSFNSVNNLLQPPTICWFQEATYQLTLFVGSVGTQNLISPAREGIYSGGEMYTISESFDLGINGRDQDYEALVVIESLTGIVNTTVQFGESSRFSAMWSDTCTRTVSQNITVTDIRVNS